MIFVFYIVILRKNRDTREGFTTNQGVSQIRSSLALVELIIPTMAEARISKMSTSNSGTNIVPCTLLLPLLMRVFDVCRINCSCADLPKNFLRLTFFFFFFFFFLCICFSWLSQLESTSDLYNEWPYKRRHYCDYTKHGQNRRSDSVYILSALGNNQ